MFCKKGVPRNFANFIGKHQQPPVAASDRRFVKISYTLNVVDAK